MKNVVIVSPDKYADAARNLAHAISKKDGFKSAYWTIKHYEDNEHNTAALNTCCFWKQGRESLYRSVRQMHVYCRRRGMYWGFDSYRAVLYADGKQQHLDQLKKEIEALRKQAENISRGSEGDDLGWDDIVFLAPIILGFMAWEFFFGSDDDLDKDVRHTCLATIHFTRRALING